MSLLPPHVLVPITALQPQFVLQQEPQLLLKPPNTINSKISHSELSLLKPVNPIMFRSSLFLALGSLASYALGIERVHCAKVGEPQEITGYFR